MVSRLISAPRAGSIAALLGAAIFVAGCGSSSSSSSVAAPQSTSSATSRAGASTGSVGTASGSVGTYLTGASGRALYMWTADTGKGSNCSGACAKAWSPLITKGKAVAGHGVNAGDLGTITRSDGSSQVTYKGHPLYYFVEDSSSGMTKGQGSDAFGAKWWLVSPAGAAITKAAASTGSASSSSSSASGGGSPY